MTQWDEIERLHGLHGAGILTDEEYEREKAKLLSPNLVADDRLPVSRKLRWWLAASTVTIVVAVVICALLVFNQAGHPIGASSPHSVGQAVGSGVENVSPNVIRVKPSLEAESAAKSSLAQTAANVGNCHSHAWYYENNGNSFDGHSLFLDWGKGAGWNVQLDPQADGGLPVHERQRLASNSYMLDLPSAVGETGPAQLLCDSDNRHATLITNSGTHVPLDATDAPNLQMAADHSEP